MTISKIIFLEVRSYGAFGAAFLAAALGIPKEFWLRAGAALMTIDDVHCKRLLGSDPLSTVVVFEDACM